MEIPCLTFLSAIGYKAVVCLTPQKTQYVTRKYPALLPLNAIGYKAVVCLTPLKHNWLQGSTLPFSL